MSEDTKLAKELQRQFLNQLNEVKMVATKENIKSKKVAKTLKILENLKKHGGLITWQKIR